MNYKEFLNSHIVPSQLGIPVLELLQSRTYSQNGEERLILEVLNKLQITKGYFVDIGGGNGIFASNTRLLAEKGWSGLNIEGDEKKFKKLSNNTKQFSSVKNKLAFVSCEKGNTLNDILEEFNIPKDFDVFSLDIDGIDYWVWKGTTYKPKLVVVEFNQAYEPKESKSVAYNPEFKYDGSDYYSASALAMTKLGKSKGYSLIAHLNCNLFFLKNEFMDKFETISVSDIKKRIVHKPGKKEMIDV